MESKIPLPTDNIYKFYALFGLMLLVTSIMGAVLVSASTNEKVHSLVKEYESIPGTKEEKESSDLAKVIEKRLEVQGSNKKFFMRALGAVIGVAIWLMGYGFWQWQTKIQPKQDEYFELQLEKLRREVGDSNEQ
jgi:uncharacterized membrane protein YidH (DUF202 family)